MQAPVVSSDSDTPDHLVPEESPVSSTPVIHSMGSTSTSERVFLTVTIRDCPVICLIDSGADVSLIPQRTLDRINATHDPPASIDLSHSIAVKALGPDTIMYTSGITCLDICIDNFIASNVGLHVVEDSVTSHEVILGADFLCRHYLAPSPAHRRLIYWPPGMQPSFVGTPISFQQPVSLDSTLVLKPNSVCFVKIQIPDVTWHEALFEPDMELLEKQVAFSRCLVTLNANYVTLEVLCLSPVEIRLKKDLPIGTLYPAEEFDFCPDPCPDLLDGSQQDCVVTDLFDLSSTDLSLP